MTTTENGTHAASTPAPATADDADGSPEDTFLDYSAREYTDLAERAPRMPMDVHIAAEIGVGYEIRALRDGIQLLTAAIKDLEAVYADSTATIKAALAEASPPPAKFSLEEAEDAQRAAEEGASG